MNNKENPKQYEWAHSTLRMQFDYNNHTGRHILTLVNSNVYYTFTDWYAFFLLGGLFLLGVIFFSLLYSMRSQAYIPILVFFHHSFHIDMFILYTWWVELLSRDSLRCQNAGFAILECEILKNIIPILIVEWPGTSLVYPFHFSSFAKSFDSRNKKTWNAYN